MRMPSTMRSQRRMPRQERERLRPRRQENASSVRAWAASSAEWEMPCSSRQRATRHGWASSATSTRTRTKTRKWPSSCGSPPKRRSATRAKSVPTFFP
ncbi:hypothetical protein IG631_16524 [Alternaria alternata]|nr:hypothetical protein IG631_16524 [Alternaria alternata]